ncbi:NAD(P)-dependent dehydrogenase (short-subunit alcohol dehydrogenase family) [Pedobacter cryoconitis]|uniref:NAD(P)-dependent dehydrogenase (Short-subunit alcohol dehydrogenase family) n=1 Tax=Pedobacter cryoconitis TaxID=188932 RepID=A0A7W9DXI5_9SPHI|nr:SDR family oxidoreductase [Pedobacter cryoconitis]MBB5635167.1 NAD(P)-dependent dehydrogenase (short-subunit alcohol dehydrogenase family) [Pedobacter cryoconitis]
MQLLNDKVVFLTGGTEGIGFECAKVYHQAGATLSILTNDKESLKKARNEFTDDRIHYILADVSSSQEIKNAITETVSKFGKIDIIHNNAGISNPSKTICETSDEEWQRLFDINVKGIYHTTKYGIAELKKNKGNILNTSSIVGEIGQPIHAGYSATKGAINALTKSMALDYAPFGIRVNSVAPAGVWTPMLRTWSKQQPDTEKIKEYLDAIHPLGYCPEGGVIADACLFLISEQARFITGCILPVSGGAELGYRKIMNTHP